MSRLLFELCGKDPRNRFSLFVWRTRLCLCQKDLDFFGVPTTFLDKSAFAASGAKTVPVLKDGNQWISDSWEIACYLEGAYPDAPSIFGGAAGQAYAKFFSNWCFSALQSKVFLLIAPDIANNLGKEDRAYFLETRAKRIGRPVASLVDEREKNWLAINGALTLLERNLANQAFLSGSAPLYPDYIAFSVFQWARLTSPLRLIQDHPNIEAWFARMESWYHDHVAKLENPPLL